MPSNSCPDCRGDLIVKSSEDKWDVTFSTLTTTANGIETDTFVLFATLSDSTDVEISLAQISGVAVGNRTEFSWSIDNENIAVSAYLEVEHDTLGTLIQNLTVSEQSQAA